jgi:hypothetical protein
MCYTAKASLTGFFLITIVAFFLWYRNVDYDRVIAAFLIVLGLIQLIEYGVHSSMNSNQAGKLLFIDLWLQCAIFSVATYIFLGNSISLALAIVFSLIFGVALVYILVTKDTYSAQVGETGHIEWTHNGGSFLGPYGWLYLIGIFAPLLVLLAHYNWTNVGLWLLILYGIVSALIVVLMFPPQAFTSMWCYLVIGFAFLAWMIGAFHTDCNNSGSC